MAHESDRLEHASGWEWWLGNGLGGWASGTASGAMTRKYHALLSVAYPSPGGLSFTQVVGLIDGVARKARIAGFSMVEFVAKRDPAGTTAFTAARIAANVIGRLAPR